MILSQSDSAYSPASYYYLTGLMARSLGSTKLYVNGVPSGSASFTVNNALADHEITPFKIGCGKSRYRSEFAYYADGEIDEVRVENVCRSADWVKLCYENQKASQTLVTLGTNIPLASVSKNKSERFGQLLTLGRLGKGITIRYVVPAGIMERVILSLFDSYGRMVWQSRYVGAASSAGVHEEFWTGHDSQNRRVSSGLYIVRLSMYDVAQQQAVVVRSPLVYISK